MSALPRMQRLAIGASALAVLVVAVLFSLPYFLSEQQIRSEVTRSLFAATGVNPRIEGEARLALLPRPAIQISDVHLDDGSRAGLAVGSLQATVQFLPLLFGEVRIATLTLERPRLTVQFAADGKLIGGLPINPRMPSTEEVPELRIVDGTILLRIEGRERVEIFSNVQASLSWSGASLTTTGTFVVRNQPANASLFIADTSALANGARSGLRARFDSEALRLSYEGGIAMRNGLQAEGSLAAESPSLRTALAWFDIPAPAPQGFGRFSVKSNAALTPLALRLTNLSVELDGNRAEGGFAVNREGPRSIVQGSLASETTDLSKYIGLFSLASSNGRDWNREQIDVAPLQTLDLDLRLSSGKLTLGKIEIGNAAIAATLKNRLLTVSIGEAQYYGGTLRGNATVRTTSETPEIRIDADLANFDLERGLGGLIGFRRIEGTGTLTLALAGNGTSIHEIVRNLSGDGQLSMKQGALNGVNAELVLRRLERKPLSGTGDLRGGRTAFERLVATVRVEKGVAKLAAFDVDSRILKIRLAGDASIVRRDLDLRGTASLVRPPQPGTPHVAFDLPFMIQGSWENPYLLPDPEALIRHSGAAAPLLDAVRGRAAREAMRNVIETVTGLQSIGELPANPTFEPPSAAAPVAVPVPSSIAPISAPAPALQPTQ